MPEARPILLPIDPFVPRVIDALRSGRDVVLVAEPGAGKTTRIAPGILRAQLPAPPNQHIIMLQPRRVAARAAAARIAFEQGWTLGDEVGYQVRFERVLSRNTPLRVLTEGILVRRLVADPELAGVGCVLLDEFHERSIHSDLSLAMLREAKAVRPDLRLIVMSATLDADAVAEFLRSAAQVEVFHVPGRLFPVEIEYAGDSPAPIEDRVADVLGAIWSSELAASRRDAGRAPSGSDSGTQASASQEHPQRASRNQAAKGLPPASHRDAANCDDSHPQDILVFLPGVREIERTISAIERLCARRGYEALPLHGSLTKDEQDRAVNFDPAARPRVICATNIAETSLTLPGVRVVIDSGLVRQAGYDASRGLETLSTARISKASAQQRSGRAGRVAAGRCIRLWSQMTQHRLADFDVPEIRRVDLSEALLAVRAWGGEPASFGWYEAPEQRLLDAGQKLLEMIGAVEAGRLTPLGRALQRLPLHPREARLLTAAPPHLASEAATVAALLGEGAEVPGRRTANVRELLEAFQRRRLEPAQVRAVERARDALLAAVERADTHAANVASLEELLLLAYPDRVCRRREGDPALARLVDGGGVRLADPSAVRGDLFLALDVRQGSTAQKQQADVRLVAMIEESWLQRDLPQHLVREETAEFDERAQRVVAVRRRRYRDLVLSEERGGATTDWNAAEAILRERFAGDAAAAFIDEDEVLGPLYRRVDFAEALAAQHSMHFNKLPSRQELIWSACAGAASAQDVREVARSTVANQLRGTNGDWLERMAPDSVIVPAGSRIRLDWSNARPPTPAVRCSGAPIGPGLGPSDRPSQPAAPPVLAVRLQELFGLPQTPRVGNGTVPVVLHLLGPNMRPVQITDDLASFWKNTYPQVRKDLRARYPKHAWPEDPLSAPPIRGARRRSPA